MPDSAPTDESDISDKMDHQAEPQSYGDEAPLTHLLGDSARVRIIGAFVAERGNDINISEVARLAGIARSTVYNHIGPLKRLGVIENTRDVADGHSSLYQLNEESEIADMLFRLEGITLQKLIDENYFD